MTFKDSIIEKEFYGAPVLLRIIAQDLDKYSRSALQKEITITRVLEFVPGDSGVHEDCRAFDVRDQHENGFVFTENEITELLAYINGVYQRNDGKPTMIHHSFNGGPKHLHVQIATLTKAYMPLKGAQP